METMAVKEEEGMGMADSGGLLLLKGAENWALAEGHWARSFIIVFKLDHE